MEEPLRYHRTFGLDAEQLDELEARIEDILPDPWDKGTGRPKSLSLREAIMVTLLYERQNMIEEVIADLFGGLPGHRLGNHHRIHPADRAGYRGVPTGRRGSQADDTGQASAGRRHVVAMLVMGARPRDVGREI